MRAPYPPLTRSPFPNGEGLGGATLRVNLYKERCPIKNHSRPFLWKGQTSEARRGWYPRVRKSRFESQPPPLRGTSFQRKEGVCRLPASSFRAKARNLFRLRSRKDVRRGITGNTVLPTTSSRFESQLPPPSGHLLPKEEGKKWNECGEAATLIPHFLETLPLISADFHPRNN